MIASLNNLLVRLHRKDLMIPLSTKKLIENIICSDFNEYDSDNVNTWRIDCCNNKCNNCGVSKYISNLLEIIKAQIPGSLTLELSFSSWQYIVDNDKKNSKVG